MEPLFKVEIEENRKMWYEDYFHTLQKKLPKTYHLVIACYFGLCIIFMIYSWIKEGRVVLTGGDIFVVICFTYAVTYDYVFAFLYSLIQQRRMRKRTGLPYILTSTRFYEECMEWSNPYKSGTIPYSEITELQTTKNMFILLCPKDKCRFLVSKNGFTVGSPLAFEQFISSKIAR